MDSLPPQAPFRPRPPFLQWASVEQPSATSPLFFDNLRFEHFDKSVNHESRLALLSKCSKWRLSKNRGLVADGCCGCLSAEVECDGAALASCSVSMCEFAARMRGGAQDRPLPSCGLTVRLFFSKQCVLYLCKIFARWVYKDTNARDDMTMRCFFSKQCVCIFVKYLQDRCTIIQTHAMT